MRNASPKLTCKLVLLKWAINLPFSHRNLFTAFLDFVRFFCGGEDVEFAFWCLASAFWLICIPSVSVCRSQLFEPYNSTSRHTRTGYSTNKRTRHRKQIRHRERAKMRGKWTKKKARARAMEKHKYEMKHVRMQAKRTEQIPNKNNTSRRMKKKNKTKKTSRNSKHTKSGWPGYISVHCVRVATANSTNSTVLAWLVCAFGLCILNLNVWLVFFKSQDKI